MAACLGPVRGAAARRVNGAPCLPSCTMWQITPSSTRTRLRGGAVGQPAAALQEAVPQAAAAGRRLVVAVDHTEGSYRAVKWTISHLYRPGDVLTLLHVVPGAPTLGTFTPWGLAAPLPPEPGLQESCAESARAYFSATLMSLASEHGAACELEVMHGSACSHAVSSAIVSKAEELAAALVVLTDNRRGVLDGLFQAPVSRQVAAACRRPTLVLTDAHTAGI